MNLESPQLPAPAGGISDSKEFQGLTFAPLLADLKGDAWNVEAVIGVGAVSQVLLSIGGEGFAYELVPAEMRDSVAAHLAADILERGTSVTTGVIGTLFILDVLLIDRVGGRTQRIEKAYETICPDQRFKLAISSMTL